MEDIIYFILMAAVMVGGAVSSVNKKKKQREETLRKTRRQQVPEEIEVAGKPARKSLAEVLEDLARNNPQDYNYESPDESEENADDYFERETSHYDRIGEGGRVTRDHAGDTAAYAVSSREQAPSVPILHEEPQEGRSSLANVLGGEFDLHRAVIESEILNPKYKEY